jgi:hypothetical protein
MRGLEENTQAALHLTHDAKSRVSRAWTGFIDFAARDNVLEVALGLMYSLPSPSYLTLSIYGRCIFIL